MISKHVKIVYCAGRWSAKLLSLAGLRKCGLRMDWIGLRPLALQMLTQDDPCYKLLVKLSECQEGTERSTLTLQDFIFLNISKGTD